MANTNIEAPTAVLAASGQDGNEAHIGIKLNGEDLSGVQKDAGGAQDNVASNHSTEKHTGLAPSEAKRTSSTARPTLVQLGSSSSTATQPKRFSAVNINKKFLEKNSPASAPSPSSQLTPLAAPGSNARPQAQSAISHSRLVTAKLTSVSPASAASAGWSRPSSAAPSNIAGSHSPAENSPRSSNASLGPSSNTPGAPQLPHPGKVIQPQPKSAILASKLSTEKPAVERPGKGVWGNVRATAPLSANSMGEFPTAAEVAQVNALLRTNKQTDEPVASDAPPSTNQAEADTFRGVHLDPNAHHWDEMEEDDGSFLDGVIEFNDGRQYKIEATEAQVDGSLVDSVLRPEDSRSNADSTSVAGDSPSVRKEDRFVDDFDRSWPRSRPPSHPTREVSVSSSTWSTAPGIKSQVLSQPPENPPSADGPRVLFNERSNKLEPYGDSHRPPRGSTQDRDSAVNPSELKSPRDVSWGSRGGTGQNEPSSRFGNRRFSSASSTDSGSFAREKDFAPPSPRIFKEPLTKERGDKLRRSDMGPPPLPPHAIRGETRRQLPPHMSPITPHQPLAPGHTSPRDSRFQPPRQPQGTDSSVRSPLPPPSPALSHASAKLSPSVPTHILPTLVTPQLESVQKDYMHTAAERAKQRRQQEEAERDRERERARQKAAELEAKSKPNTMPSESASLELPPVQMTSPTHHDDAVAFLEDAINSVDIPEPTALPEPTVKLPRRPDVSPPQMRPKAHDSRPPPLPSKSNATQASLTRSTSSELQSWRTSVTRPSPPQVHASSRPKPPELSSNTAMDQVETLVATSGTDLEVVDFSDMGQLLNGAEVSLPASAPAEKRSQRAVASDFFEDVKEIKVDKEQMNEALEPSWRPKQAEPAPWVSPDAGKSASIGPEIHPPSASTKPSASSQEHPLSHQVYQTKNQRSQAPYKVASMSALDDTMSRIKGALAGMHIDSTETAVKSGSLKARWVPPALRPRDHEMMEVFSNTSANLPPSPLSPGPYTVCLPKISRSLEPVNRRQLMLFSKPSYVRWEILSFDPPVEGMSKRDLSLNNLLFRKPLSTFKGQVKYRIHLPRRTTRGYQAMQGAKNGVNSFSRPAADGLISWRKSRDSSATTDSSEQTLPSVPENQQSDPNPTSASQTKMEPTSQFLRPRALPKMPDGSGVAFYRDSRIDTVKEDSQPSVSFFVASELETPSPASQPETPVRTPVPDAVVASRDSALEKSHPRETSSADNTITSWPPENIQPSGQPGNRGTSVSADSTPLKPRSSWSRSSKDATSRGPDPELLKAVWSQTSNQPGSHGVNSLQAIPDDLTALPFIISEMKSEDGETPPAVPSGPPSRMSLHDVTRAFQQPTTSNSSSPRRSPPAAPSAAPQRNSSGTFSYHPPPPQQANNFRPGYHYPSPMMNHSPAPNMIYPAPLPPSPMPSRMQVNGSNPVYGQPMWMPPPGHQPNGMMRPVPTSPYHGPMVYPHSSPYTPGNMHLPAAQPTPQVNRDRNMAMVSPVMGHAAAMYGSPAIMHTPLAPQNSTFVMPPAANHGAPRPENHQPMHHQPRGHAHAQPNSFSYTPYERPGW